MTASGEFLPHSHSTWYVRNLALSGHLLEHD